MALRQYYAAFFKDPFDPSESVYIESRGFGNFTTRDGSIGFWVVKTDTGYSLSKGLTEKAEKGNQKWFVTDAIVTQKWKE